MPNQLSHPAQSLDNQFCIYFIDLLISTILTKQSNTK